MEFETNMYLIDLGATNNNTYSDFAYLIGDDVYNAAKQVISFRDLLKAIFYQKAGIYETLASDAHGYYHRLRKALTQIDEAATLYQDANNDMDRALARKTIDHLIENLLLLVSNYNDTDYQFFVAKEPNPDRDQQKAEDIFDMLKQEAAQRKEIKKRINQKYKGIAKKQLKENKEMLQKMIDKNKELLEKKGINDIDKALAEYKIELAKTFGVIFEELAEHD